MKKIIGVGNALVDILIRLESDAALDELGLPKGSMQMIDRAMRERLADHFAAYDAAMSAGGSASNTITGIGRLKGEAAFVGTISDDRIGEFYHSDMRHCGVQPMLNRRDGGSGVSVVLISPDSERTMATCLGSAPMISADDLAEQTLAGYDYVYIEGYLIFNLPLVEHILKLARKLNIRVAYDFASYNVVEANLEVLRHLVREHIDIIFANEQEAHAFTGESDPLRALDAIAEYCETAVVKVGGKGSYIKQGGVVRHIGTLGTTPIDTTGAGDLYAAGFMYGLCHGWGVEACGCAGAVLSGKVIEVVGPKMDDRHWEQIHHMMAEIKAGNLLGLLK